MKKTLRKTLLTWLLTFSVITIVIFISSSSIYIHQKTRITNFITKIYNLHLDVQKDFNITNAFLTYEASNLAFFETMESQLLDDHKEMINEINRELAELSGTRLNAKLAIGESLDSFKTDFDNYILMVDQLVELILERGFKDYGVDGEMRRYVHQLETYKNLDQAIVLGLRRHEKDYIIRNEKQYVTKLNNLANEFLAEINADKRISGSDKKRISDILQNYVILFNKLVDLDNRIGFKTPGNGKKSDLLELEITIEQRFNQIIEKAEIRKTVLFKYMEWFYGLFFLSFLLISLQLSRQISGKISAPITGLANYIKRLSENNLKPDESTHQDFNNYETSVLFQEFNSLIVQIKKEQDDLNTAQTALLENEKKYRQLADQLPQPVFETDQFGNFTYVNSTWINMLNYAEKEIRIGLNINTILTTETGPLILGDETRGAAEHTVIKADGTTFPALVYTNRININKKLIGFRGVIINITERKHRMDVLKEQKERAEQADRLKSAFLANISHEIRTPMNAIIGFSNLLGSHKVDESQRINYANQIKASGYNLLELIDDIIDISRIETGEISIRKEEFSVKDIFDELYLNIKERLTGMNKTHIELHYTIPEEIYPGAIITDPYKLRQIIINLLSNAAKFTERGSITFGVEKSENDMLLFFVKDTGIGLGKTEQIDVFNRFIQFSNLSRSKKQGTGLGLAICKSLIEILGGNIWVNSQIGKGSTFSFTIKAPLIESAKTLQ